MRTRTSRGPGSGTGSSTTRSTSRAGPIVSKSAARTLLYPDCGGDQIEIGDALAPFPVLDLVHEIDKPSDARNGDFAFVRDVDHGTDQAVYLGLALVNRKIAPYAGALTL